MDQELSALEARVEQLERRCTLYQRRWRVQAALALTTVVGALLISPSNRAAIAQASNGIAERVARLEHKTKFIHVSDGEMYIRTTNLHIENGMGSTETANGLGNLIVGYNEVTPGSLSTRTGSHNIVGGSENSYSSFGGLVLGKTNSIEGQYASVTGGHHNVAGGDTSSVSGGDSNLAGGISSTVSGGATNSATGNVSSVSGGSANEARADVSSVAGGQTNIASALAATVTGGFGNNAAGLWTVISGGTNRTQSAPYGWAAGSEAPAHVLSGNFQSP